MSGFYCDIIGQVEYKCFTSVMLEMFFNSLCFLLQCPFGGQLQPSPAYEQPGEESTIFKNGMKMHYMVVKMI